MNETTMSEYIKGFDAGYAYVLAQIERHPHLTGDMHHPVARRDLNSLRIGGEGLGSVVRLERPDHRNLHLLNLLVRNEPRTLAREQKENYRCGVDKAPSAAVRRPAFD